MLGRWPECAEHDGGVCADTRVRVPEGFDHAGHDVARRHPDERVGGARADAVLLVAEGAGEYRHRSLIEGHECLGGADTHVDRWVADFAPKRALAMGFHADTSMDDLVRWFIEDDLAPEHKSALAG